MIEQLLDYINSLGWLQTSTICQLHNPCKANISCSHRSQTVIIDFDHIKDLHCKGQEPLASVDAIYKNEELLFIEIKGCTLEEDNIVKFPDAKTDRGVKHVKELIKAKEDGYLAYIIIVIQMKDVLYFTPNIERHKEFGDVLKEADEKGVKILAYDSIVNIDNIKLNKPVKVVL